MNHRSQTRFIYDNCEFVKRLEESTNPLDWILDDSRYYNRGKCRPVFGIVGGTAVSHVKGNLVDMESDLTNRTRAASLCPSEKWHPTPADGIIRNHPTITNANGTVINTNLVHLPPCQLVAYPKIPLPDPFNKCC
jgi:hypothetical protein